MERIEVNVETGIMQIIQLTPEEIAANQAQLVAWQAEQDAIPPVVDLQAQVDALTAELNALKAKFGS